MRRGDDKHLKRTLITFLENNGFTATPIPEGSTPSADICATDAKSEHYLFEVKSRVTSWTEGAQALTPPQGSPTTLLRIDPTGTSNALSRVIAKAASQLAASSTDTTTLRIAWFFAHPSDLRYHFNRIADTAYGATIVAALGQSPKRGFYVRHAAFAQWPDLDAILLGPFNGLLLNDLSPRYPSMRQSALADCCDGYVTDPKELAANAEAYYLDPTEPEAHPGNSIDRLQEKYSLDGPHFVDLVRYGAV